MSRPKKLKENVLVPAINKPPINSGQEFGEDQYNTIFQMAIRGASLFQLGQMVGKNEGSISNALSRIRRNANRDPDQKVFGLDPIKFCEVTWLNEIAKDYIEWQAFKVEEKLTAKQIRKRTRIKLNLIVEYMEIIEHKIEKGTLL